MWKGCWACLLAALPGFAFTATADAPAAHTPAARTATADTPARDTAGRDVAVRDAVRLDAVLVTARRRPERRQDVPQAITALNGDELESRGATDIAALGMATPNLSIHPARAFNGSVTAHIRGIGQFDPIWGAEPGVGVYIDDVHLARPQGALLDVLDDGGGSHASFSIDCTMGIDTGPPRRCRPPNDRCHDEDRDQDAASPRRRRRFRWLRRHRHP